jgi:predicted component of type VI protein secretion system
MQPGVSNVEQEGVSSERPLRYREEWVTLQDAFGSEEESMAVARFNFTIRFAHESNDSWKVCPVARLIGMDKMRGDRIRLLFLQWRHLEQARFFTNV